MIKVRILLVLASLLLISTKQVFGQQFDIKYDQIKYTDTIKLSVNELETIDYPFELIIKNHLKIIKRKKWFLQKRNHILKINISDFSVMHKEVEDRKYSKFVLNNYGVMSGYDISCVMINEKTLGKSLKRWFIEEKLFYYKYEDLDVIFTTDLDINFSSIIGIKTLEYTFEDTKYERSDTGKYYDYDLLRSSYKDYQKDNKLIYSGYKLLNQALYSVEHRTLYKTRVAQEYF